MKSFGRFFSVFLACASLQCSSGPKNTAQNLDVFRYNVYGGISSLDPAFARNPRNIWPVNQMFNGLVQLDHELNIVPEIAQSWDISADGLLYTFQLRDDVYFHESSLFGPEKTRKVMASDFVYSFNRLNAPEVGSPGAWVLNTVAAYTALDTHTFQVQLKYPFPAFLGLLTMRYCSVVPREVVEHFGEDFRQHPIGTGPFYFKRWEEEVKLVLRKNPRYFEKDSCGQQLPYLEAVSIRFIEDLQSEFLLFMQGELDFLNSLDASYKDELLTPEGNLQQKYADKLQIIKGPYLNTEYIGFYLDQDHPALRSPEIREAINIGFDRKQMLRYLRNNIGSEAFQGIIPKGLAGTSSIPLEYNPERAKQLVQAFEKKHNLKPKLRLATDANYLDICEFLQRELQKVGINIQIDLMPPASLRQAKSSGKLEMFRASWIADYPDAENYLSLFYSKNFSPRGPNYTHYRNETFDGQYELALNTLAPEKRKILYQQMDSLAMQDYPIVPLYYDEVIQFIPKNIKGLVPNPINLLHLKRVYKTKDHSQ